MRSRMTNRMIAWHLILDEMMTAASERRYPDVAMWAGLADECWRSEEQTSEMTDGSHTIHFRDQAMLEVSRSESGRCFVEVREQIGSTWWEATVDESGHLRYEPIDDFDVAETNTEN